MKRVLSLALAVLLMLSLTVNVFAAQTVQPRYTHIISLSYNISLSSSAESVICHAACQTRNSMEIQIECKLQRYNNSKWNNVKTWTASGNGHASINKTWAVPGGYDYRIYVTYKVYDSTGTCVESVSYDDSVWVPAS